MITDAYTRTGRRVVDARQPQPKSAPAAIDLYEATSDEYQDEDDDLYYIDAKRLNADGTLAGDEVTFRTLPAYEPPED
jgi:hypothetical protein